jgi:hypothetical protein
MPILGPYTIDSKAQRGKWFPTVLGPFLEGVARFLVAPDWNTFKLRAYRSLDTGQTWVEQNSGGAPTISNDGLGQNLSIARDGSTLWVAYPDGSNNLALIQFNLSTLAWGTPITSTIALGKQDGYSDGGGDFKVLLARRPADSTLVILYQSQSESIAGHRWDRTRVVRYDGSWSASAEAFGVSGETRDYTPVGAILGSSDRIHLFSSSANSTNSEGRLYHRTLTSGNLLETIQLVTTDVYPLMEGPISPAVVLPNGDLLVAFMGTSFNVSAAVAASADLPTWALETITSNPANKPDGSFTNVAGAVCGSTAFTAWTRSFREVWVARKTNSVWQVPEFVWDQGLNDVEVVTARGEATFLGLPFSYAPDGVIFEVRYLELPLTAAAGPRAWVS